MDQRRFRSLCGAGIFLIALGVNGRLLIAAFSGDFSADYVLLRYIGALLIGSIGMRIMDSILFRPRPSPEAAAAHATEPTTSVETPAESNAETP